ncbi:MAG TPA: TetR/AcrR family transcriptional regulator [Thermoleophilaceae bacterium]
MASRPEPRRPGPGRPPSGARERILEAGLEVLKEEGYAGLTTAKVAARAGENKALIGYHFGSKQGLVAAVGREVAESITAEVIGGLEAKNTVEDVVRGLMDGLWRILDRDERLARLYFDLAAVSVVEPEVRSVMQEMKAFWREVVGDLLHGSEAASVYVIAGIEGLALERLDRGETPALKKARRMFVSSASAALSEPGSAS